MECRSAIIGGVIFFIFVIVRARARIALAKNGLLCLTFPQHWKKLVDEEREEFENDVTTLTHDTTDF